MKREKVVLAYSGGLDTSVAIKWLQDEYNLDVVALCVDVGQGEELKPIEKKAWKLGCVSVTVVDARKRFCDEYIIPAIRANAMYEGKYPLSTSLARPLIAQCVVETALRENAKFVAHGSTGKGNDQVRFDVSFAALAPHLKIIAPVREWGMTREQEIEYAKEHNIPVPVTKKSPYSVDLNLWGKSTECGVLEDPWVEPPAGAHVWVRPVAKTPAAPVEITLEFKEGVPTALNGKKLDMVKLIGEVNALGAEHGVGLVDMVENRLVGIKSRETYEVPGATIIIAAHRELEALTLTRDLLHYKQGVELRYADLIYDGLWFTQLREALEAFFAATQRTVSGEVRLKLGRGSCRVTGRRSPNSLYDTALATYDEADKFDHSAAVGFIKLWGLPHMIAAKTRKKK